MGKTARQKTGKRQEHKNIKTKHGTSCLLLFYTEDTNFASVVILSNACSRNWNLRFNTIFLIPKNTTDCGNSFTSVIYSVTVAHTSVLLQSEL